MLRSLGPYLALLATLPLCLSGVGGIVVCVHSCGQVDFGDLTLADSSHRAHQHHHVDSPREREVVADCADDCHAVEACCESTHERACADSERADDCTGHASECGHPVVSADRSCPEEHCPEEHCPEADPCVDFVVDAEDSTLVQLSVALPDFAAVPLLLAFGCAPPDIPARISRPLGGPPVPKQPEILRTTVLLL